MASGAAVSPSSSPRLPSPPPIAEDQTAPQSPGFTPIDHGRLGGTSSAEQAASRRIRPGTKADNMAEGPPLIKFGEIESAFQLTEHLKALHFYYTHPAHLPTTIPIDSSTAQLLAETPEGIDRTLWLYELCRFLVQKVNGVIVALFADTPPCSAQTCQEMRASEWQYLCAVHDPPKSCCAIDYCCHTLDWAANTLTSPKHFPSRLTLGQSADGSASQQPVRQLTNIFRRVYRIFAHAWFSHRDMFWRIEGRTGLYILFKTVCDAYSLIPEDNYTIPPEAEGKEPLEAPPPAPIQQQAPAPLPPSILKRPSDEPTEPAASQGTEDVNTATGLVPGATARRHKHTPSKGVPVATVMEENEDDDMDANAPRSTDMTAAERRSSVVPRQDPDLSIIETPIHPTEGPDSTISSSTPPDTTIPNTSTLEHNPTNIPIAQDFAQQGAAAPTSAPAEPAPADDQQSMEPIALYTSPEPALEPFDTDAMRRPVATSDETLFPAPPSDPLETKAGAAVVDTSGSTPALLSADESVVAAAADVHVEGEKGDSVEVGPEESDDAGKADGSATGAGLAEADTVAAAAAAEAEGEKETAKEEGKEASA